MPRYRVEYKPDKSSPPIAAVDNLVASDSVIACRFWTAWRIAQAIDVPFHFHTVAVINLDADT